MAKWLEGWFDEWAHRLVGLPIYSAENREGEGGHHARWFSRMDENITNPFLSCQF